jgi:phospholipase C
MPDDRIKHVVLLMLENRSFDQVLGCFQTKYPDLDGIDPGQPHRFNVDSSGTKYFQLSGAAKQTDLDPKHELERVLNQLRDHNSGFVLDYEKYAGANSDQRQQVMSYYDREAGRDLLPALYQLADDFTICDRWFSSLPGPTWPNRFFALSGTCSGKVDMPDGPSHPDLAGFFNQTQNTIFDRLDEAKRSYTIYYYDIPCSLVLAHQRQLHQVGHYRNINFFFDQDARDESTFPDFVFIEPKYSGVDQNDDHPPHNVVKGEKLIADVYNAIRSNDLLWNSTLLIVAFDEHGGFYDHVEPPEATPPGPAEPNDQYAFNRYGVRVPALLISPWVDPRVEHTLFDHTSILRYLIEKWGLNPLGQSYC